MVRIDTIKGIQEFGFGQYFCPWMIEAHYRDGSWAAPVLKKHADFTIDPAAKVFHYGQEIFEGLKVFRQTKDGLALFRPDANIARMKKSAEIMAMPPFPPDYFLKSLLDLSRKCADFVPAEPGALYLRPTMIGTSPTLGVAPSTEYIFYILASPVGGYFKGIDANSPAAVSLWITPDYVRAAHGGLGAAKAGANYAASLRAVAESKKRGFSNVLFLDAIQHKYFEELSGMNVFVVEDGVLKTPPIGDTILDGITRDSILKIAASLKIRCLEEAPHVDRFIEGLNKGSVTEVFACGTGAVITAVTEVGYQKERYTIGKGEVGPVTRQLYQQLLAIQFGRENAPVKDWVLRL